MWFLYRHQRITIVQYCDTILETNVVLVVSLRFYGRFLPHTLD